MRIVAALGALALFAARLHSRITRPPRSTTVSRSSRTEGDVTEIQWVNPHVALQGAWAWCGRRRAYVGTSNRTPSAS